MLDKTKKFLIEKFTIHNEIPQDEQYELLDDIWKEKTDFVRHCLLEHTKIFGSFTVKNGDKFYKDRLAKADAAKLSIESKDDTPDSTSINENHHLFNDDIQIEFLKKFLSKEYDPPKNPLEVQLQLETLLLFYTHLVPSLPISPPRVITERMDLTMARLITQAVLSTFAINHKGRDLDRTDRSTNTKRKTSMAIKDKVLHIYYTIESEKRDGKGPYAIAKIIKKRWKNVLKEKPPHLNTIVSYLREEKLVK